MLAILKETLDSQASPEFVSMIDEAHALFDDYELPDFTFEFEQILGIADNSEPGDLNTQVYELTRELQFQVLHSHLVFPSTEATVSNLNKILTALMKIEQTEFIEEVLSICENEINPTEAFCEVIALVGGYEISDIVASIEHVEISLIRRTMELMIRRKESEFLNVIDHTTRTEVINRYKDFSNDPAFPEAPLMSRYFEEGAELGLTFDTYIKYVREHLQSEKADAIAREYIAAALISCDVPKNPREVIKDKLNDVYTEIDIITPILISVDKQLLDLEIRTNAGIKKVE